MQDTCIKIITNRHMNFLFLCNVFYFEIPRGRLYCSIEYLKELLQINHFSLTFTGEILLSAVNNSALKLIVTIMILTGHRRKI